MQSDQVRNIILVGFMASGKSSVGRALSRRCGWTRWDADDEIVAWAGKPIADIFRDSGEDAFRELERSVVKEICLETGRIIAAGGGSFIDDENRRTMLEFGTVFYRREPQRSGAAFTWRRQLVGTHHRTSCPADAGLFPSPPRSRNRQPNPGPSGPSHLENMRAVDFEDLIFEQYRFA